MGRPADLSHRRPRRVNTIFPDNVYRAILYEANMERERGLTGAFHGSVSGVVRRIVFEAVKGKIHYGK